MTLSLKQKILAAFGSALLVLVVGIVSFATVLELRSSTRWVEHTQQVLGEIGDVLSGLQDGETSARGFVITGEDDYLQPYRTAVATVPSSVDRARQLTRDNAIQQRRLDTLGMLVTARFAKLQATVVARRSGHPEQAAALVRDGEGKRIMDAARALIVRLEDTERQLLAGRVAREERAALIALVVIAGGSSLAFLLALAINQAIRADVAERERTREQLERQSVLLEEQASELEAQQEELEQQMDETQAVNVRLEEKVMALARATAALQRSNTELDQFAYVASHDLKAPLRGIANLSQWIEEDVGDALQSESRDQMQLLRGRVHRMEALIDGILTYSRAARVRAKPERVDTGALVSEAIELLAPPDMVAIRVQPGMPTVVTERVPLQQVFMNLLGNAIKYGRKVSAGDGVGPMIEVAWRDQGAQYEFSVADNGPGIAPQYHERVFGIFQTLEARDKVEGTGIGLSVVKKIVEAKGGRVWIGSADGRGATFHFLWPKHDLPGD